jgi:hypothetical protein
VSCLLYQRRDFANPIQWTRNRFRKSCYQHRKGRSKLPFNR